MRSKNGIIINNFLFFWGGDFMSESHVDKTESIASVWRKRLFKLNIAIAGVVLAVEIAIFFLLFYQGKIEQSISDYLFWYVCIPTIQNGSALCFEFIIFKLFPKNQRLLDYSMILTLVVFCTVIASTHFVYASTMTLFCVPVLSSVMFGDKKLTNITTYTSMLGILVSLFKRLLETFPRIDDTFIPNGVISLSLIWLAGYIAKMIIRILNDQNNKLIQATVEAKEAQQDALEANKAKSRFLANMSHEIRTPINGILGMDEMIIRETTDDDIRDYALNIRGAGRNLLSIVNDILDFSKIESGKMEIIPVQYELFSLLNDCYNLLFSRAQEAGLELRLENDPTIPAQLFGDEVRVRQIIMNLLTNAVKYTKAGSVVLRADWVKLDGDNMKLVISVTDTGIGISDENMDKLFTSFQRIDEKDNRGIEGTGLGLTITKQLVDLMEGSITVKSEFGKGSEFTVELVQKIIGTSTLGNFSSKYTGKSSEITYKESFRAPNADILVVDDVPLNLKVFCGMLKQTRINIDTADSGEKCLELAAQKHYDIIFLDHMMPGMDGVETFRRLKEITDCPNKNTPTIMLTANAISSARAEYINEGFTEYLSKPIRDVQLEELIIRYLPPELVITDDSAETVPDAVPEEDQPIMVRLGALLNTESAMHYFVNNEDFYLDILKDFVNENQLSILNEYFDKSDYENYRINVHSLKSTAKSVGADDLSEEARLLEEAAKISDADYITAHHEDVMKRYSTLLDRLREILS